MSNLISFLQRHHWHLALIGGAWVCLWLVISAGFRRAKGKPLTTPSPADALFVERWASGRSMRSVLTRIGGARNCLKVAVTPDALVVCPHFPFTLLFLPEIYGLDREIPRSAIVNVSERKGFFGNLLLIEFEASPGAKESLELRLRSPAEFRAALSAS